MTFSILNLPDIAISSFNRLNEEQETTHRNDSQEYKLRRFVVPDGEDAPLEMVPRTVGSIPDEQQTNNCQENGGNGVKKGPGSWL